MFEFIPKISIIIPVYNGSNYMREAIDSALAQTYKNIEIIVINDGSTDDTEEIALSYGNKIRYFHKKNGGQSSALNYGIDKMKGDYFSWLSHDDKYYPQKIETQVEYLRKLDKKEAIICTGYTIINSYGNILKRNNETNFDKISPTYNFLCGFTINGNTLLIPHKVFNEVGKFNELRPHTSDIEFFFTLSRKYKFYCIHKELVFSRSHLNQATFRNYQYHIYESNLFLIDALNSLSQEELLSISPFQNDIQVLENLINFYSKGGYKIAASLALERLVSTTLCSSTKVLQLRFKSRIAIQKKYIKRKFKKLL